MAFTFVEIEERKTKNVMLLFAFLAALYAASFVVLWSGLRFFAGLSWKLSGSEWCVVLGTALLVAACHWLVAAHSLMDRVLAAVVAQPLDPHDTYHQRLARIIEEVTVATGRPGRIAPYVIDTPAMNACAVTDFSGRAAIAVTEGVLARLTRSQLEAVIGHEAAHLAQGDSLSKTIFCGLFGLHEAALKRLGGLFSEDSGSTVRGRGAGLILFVMVVLWITTRAKQLCELLVSRELEYRADAVAVRLTRNPLALAEALRALSSHWRGVGTGAESLSTIFIVDLGDEPLNEREGWWAGLFSTHPPTDQRINALLGMTHLSPEAFERGRANTPRRGKQMYRDDAAPSPKPSAPHRWLVWSDEQWKGPFGVEELLQFPGMTLEHWVRPEGGEGAVPAYHEEPVRRAFESRYRQAGRAISPTPLECPTCRIPLTRVVYEGVPIDECPSCHGCYMTPHQVGRVLVRDEYEFPESIHRLAKAMPAVRSPHRVAKRFNALPYNRLKDRQCLACGSAVVRKFYTEAYLVEVDQCWMCGLAWLDRHERELLQCLYEAVKAAPSGCGIPRPP